MSDITFASRRSPVYGRRGMVAASQPLAVAAGLEILAAGGNAADAAVATAAALNVTEPTSTGIGGDCFALYYEASHGQVTALNGSGRAPAALTLERLRAGRVRPRAAALPSLHHHRAGRLRRLVRPDRTPRAPAPAAASWRRPSAWPRKASRSRRSPRTSGSAAAERQLAQAPGGQELTHRRPGAAGRARSSATPAWPAPCARWPRAARRPSTRARSRRRSPVTVQQAGGCLTVDDLAAHRSTWDEPISTTYRGLRVWECPPNGQGLTALLALNMLEGFDLASARSALAGTPAPGDRGDAPGLRRRSLVRRRSPVFNHRALAELLSKEYAAERRKLINPEPGHARPAPRVAGRRLGHGLLQRRRRRGQRLLVHQQQLHGLRHRHRAEPAGASPCRTAGTTSAWTRSIPNALAPRQAPVPHDHPGHAHPRRRRRRCIARFGVMGGFMQPQGHVQVVVALVDDRARSAGRPRSPALLHRGRGRRSGRHAGQPGRPGGGHPGGGRCAPSPRWVTR